MLDGLNLFLVIQIYIYLNAILFSRLKRTTCNKIGYNSYVSLKKEILFSKFLGEDSNLKMNKVGFSIPLWSDTFLLHLESEVGTETPYLFSAVWLKLTHNHLNHFHFNSRSRWTASSKVWYNTSPMLPLIMFFVYDHVGYAALYNINCLVVLFMFKHWELECFLWFCQNQDTYQCDFIFKRNHSEKMESRVAWYSFVWIWGWWFIEIVWLYYLCFEYYYRDVICIRMNNGIKPLIFMWFQFQEGLQLIKIDSSIVWTGVTMYHVLEVGDEALAK